LIVEITTDNKRGLALNLLLLNIDRTV